MAALVDEGVLPLAQSVAAPVIVNVLSLDRPVALLGCPCDCVLAMRPFWCVSSSPSFACQSSHGCCVVARALGGRRQLCAGATASAGGRYLRRFAGPRLTPSVLSRARSATACACARGK